MQPKFSKSAGWEYMPDESGTMHIVARAEDGGLWEWHPVGFVPFYVDPFTEWVREVRENAQNHD